MSLVKKRLLSIAILMTVCCLAVGGLVWQQDRELAAQEAKESAQKLLSLDKARLSEVRLTVPAGTFVVNRTGLGSDAWELRAPLQTPADAMVIDGIIQAAIDLRSTVRVGQAPNPGDAKAAAAPAFELALFGLEPARYSVIFKTQDGNSQTLLVGKKNTYDGSLYVKRADTEDVGMVSGDFAYQLDQDLFKLREKRPVILAADDVVKLQVTPAKGPGYTLERGEHGLMLTAPLRSAADTGAVGQVLGALSGLRAKSFAAESATTPAALRPFGLDKPAYTAVLHLKDQRVITLLFGELSLAGQSHSFVMEQGDHPVLELGSDWASKKLGLTDQQLRDMRVLAFDKDAVRTLSIVHGQESLTFTVGRDEKTGAETWNATAPAKAEVQSGKNQCPAVQVGQSARRQRGAGKPHQRRSCRPRARSCRDAH